MNYQGVVYLDNQDCRLVVDAEPHIMMRLRKLFDNAKPHFDQGKFTHKPISFPLTMNAAKDITWILQRYNLQISESDLHQITSKSEEYDKIIDAVINSHKDGVYKISEEALKLALPLRDHQVKFNNMFAKMGRMLLADRMGLGKTASAISTLCEPERRPAIIVVPPYLCTQWDREIKRFLPEVTTHIIKGFKNYELPQVDVVVTSYNRLAPWQDVLVPLSKQVKTLILDEAHELRHTGTAKRNLCKMISNNMKYCLGLTGTPIYNYGSEIWSVLDVIKEGCLGEEYDFMDEWCTWGKVTEPSILHSYLKSQGLMLRRTPEEAGLKFGDCAKHVYTVDADIDKLKEVEDVAKLLAISVLSGNVTDSSESAREFDWKLRHATGVAKAKPVAEFMKMVLDGGDKVVLAGWHRDCYDVWLKELASYNPVMYTGSESAAQKDKAVKEFVEGEARVFIISLRSGAGLDGLQRACSTVVFGELDWSPHVMDQVVSRLDRDGQTKPVQAFYITIPDGSDPFMMKILGVKRSQHDGLVEGKDGQAEILRDAGFNVDRVRDMAKEYLKKIGEDIPEPVPEVGLIGDVAQALRRVRLPTNNEKEMQEALSKVLPGLVPDAVVEREVKITSRSRLDFMVSRHGEKIAIELKVNSQKRADVYRQVRRYVEEMPDLSAVMLMAPWNGIPSFKVDDTPVVVVDTTVANV
jgi:hypothetical protein